MSRYKILLVIDLQKEFKDKNGKYEKIIKYCENNRDNYDIILPTLFCNNYDINPNFIDKLNWSGCDHTTSESLAIYPKNNMNLDKICYEYKYGYASEYIFKIANKEDSIDIVGCDSDACVLATAFELWDKGYNFRILTDFIYTTANDFTNEDVIKLIKRNFGTCVI